MGDLEKRYCPWCGCLILVETQTTPDGEEVLFLDGKTREYVDECPVCWDLLAYKSLDTVRDPLREAEPEMLEGGAL